jgi:hypothetical protein
MLEYEPFYTERHGSSSIILLESGRNIHHAVTGHCNGRSTQLPAIASDDA